MMKTGYGLQLRIPPGQQKKPEAARPPLRPPFFDADDDDDVEREISRQASKNKALLKVEEQHKKALEEDPSVFDYDGVYDEMKEQVARPRVQDRSERKSKYIEPLLKKAKEREREQEVIYDRKLLKERSKEDHLFQDKEKFVTGAYKKKLAEQAKWVEEERLREIREEKEDVTKKSDLSDFYFSLSKNVAFGAGSREARKPSEQEVKKHHIEKVAVQSETEAPKSYAQGMDESNNGAETSRHSLNQLEHAVKISEGTKVAATSELEKSQSGQALTSQLTSEQYKRNEDAVAAARERYLARKRAREQ